MALHSKHSIWHRLNDEVYASADLSRAMPKYRFPEPERDPRAVYAAIHDELMLDGNARQNLATFCQTWEEPELHRLMDECIAKNIVDKDEYPQTAEIEARCVHMLADLWNSPQAADTIGCSTTGSSEAAMLGGLAMKRRWEAKRKAAGQPIGKPNLITGPVQVCWHKFTRYWDVEHREIPMERGRLLMTPEEVLKRCDENTIGVAPTLGVLSRGSSSRSTRCRRHWTRIKRKPGSIFRSMWMPRAAARSFCAPDPRRGLQAAARQIHKRVGHKFGLAPLGAGWVIWRDRRDLPDELIFKVNYLGDVRHSAQFLPAGRTSRFPVLQFPAPRERRILPQGPYRLLQDGSISRRGNRQAWLLRSFCTAPTWPPASQPYAGRSKPRPIPASACTIFLTGSAAEAGKCRPILCLRIAKTSSCREFLSGRGLPGISVRFWSRI